MGSTYRISIDSIDGFRTLENILFKYLISTLLISLFVPEVVLLITIKLRSADVLHNSNVLIQLTRQISLNNISEAELFHY
jgi:hypothetical protein